MIWPRILNKNGNFIGDLFTVQTEIQIQTANVPDLLHFRARSLGLLNQNKRSGNQGSLTDVVDGIIRQRFKDGDGRLQTGPGARDAQRHGGSVPHVRVVALGEQGNDAGHVVGGAKQDETERLDGSAAHVLVDVRNGNVEQALDGAVVAGASVGHGDGVHARAAEDRVLVGHEAGDGRLGLLEAAVLDEGQTDREAAEDLLVLRLLRVLNKKYTSNLTYIFFVQIIAQKLHSTCIKLTQF